MYQRIVSEMSLGRQELSPQCLSHPGYVSDENIGTPGLYFRANDQSFSFIPGSNPTAISLSG
jgi:hypothetical protein